MDSVASEIEALKLRMDICEQNAGADPNNNFQNIQTDMNLLIQRVDGLTRDLSTAIIDLSDRLTNYQQSVSIPTVSAENSAPAAPQPSAPQPSAPVQDDGLQTASIQNCIDCILDSHWNAANTEFRRVNDNNKLPQIITATYPRNFENVLIFIKNLPDFTQQSIAYESLFNQMVRNGNHSSPDILRLAYNIKAARRLPAYSAAPSSAKTIFDAIKGRFSEAVRAIVWQGCVYIVNNAIYGRKVLDRTSCNDSGIADGKWVHATNKNQAGPENIKWYVKPITYNEGSLFRFYNKSDSPDRYLDCSYKNSGIVDGQRVHASDLSKASADHTTWSIIEQTPGSNKFHIKNKATGRILDVSHEESGMASGKWVHAAQADRVNNLTSLWEFSPAPSP